MRAMLIFVGLLTILGGLLPFLSERNLLPGFLANIPTSGSTYQGIIVGIGALALIYGIIKSRYG